MSQASTSADDLFIHEDLFVPRKLQIKKAPGVWAGSFLSAIVCSCLLAAVG